MRKILLTITLAIATATAFAQEVYSSSGKPVDEKKWGDDDEEKGFNPNKMIYGGGLIFGIGSGVTNIGVTPIIGYKLTEKFSAGVGLGYQYLKVKNRYSAINPSGLTEFYDLKTSIYTGSVWARLVLFQNIFAHVEPEMNVFSGITSAYYNKGELVKVRETFSFPRLLVGGGLRQPISDRVSFVGLILYDVIQDSKSPYASGLDIRFGVAAGF